MEGKFLMSIAMCMTLVIMTTAAPASSESNDKGMFLMENYQHFMPKQQQKFAEMALKNAGVGSFGSSSSSGDKDDSKGSSGGYASSFYPKGNYKHFMPAIEQKWFEKFNGNFMKSA